MAFSAGSQRMIDFWADYEKPTPKEARRRKRERELNVERLPWVLRFKIGRKCEGKHSKPCKVTAYWAYIRQSRNWFEPNSKLEIVCWHHLRQICADDDYDIIDDWYKEHDWVELLDDGTTREIKYKNE